MSQLSILDTFCCEGGAGAGYYQVGFKVTGIDIVEQHRYPFTFVHGDALKLLADHDFLAQFDAVHASPPCQAHSKAQRIQNNDHPDLIEPVRKLLIASGLPYVIENVRGAPLLDPIELCGCMFPGLGVYRERLFETSFKIIPPKHVEHTDPVVKMGRPPLPGHRMHVVGHFSGVDNARKAMGGMHWASREGLREALPIPYTRFIGKALIRHIERSRGKK